MKKFGLLLVVSSLFISNAFAATGCGGPGWSAKSGGKVCLSKVVYNCKDGKITDSGEICSDREDGHVWNPGQGGSVMQQGGSASIRETKKTILRKTQEKPLHLSR